MPPPAVLPETILECAPTESRVLKVDANVIAYFGDYFHAFQTGLRQAKRSTLSAAPASSAHTAPANTASDRSRS
jgi:hypothetical protein